MSKILLTRPSGISSGIPGTIKTNIEIPSTSTVECDSVSILYNHGAKWIYTLTDQDNNKVVTGEVTGNHVNGQVRWNQFGVVGDLIAHQVQVTLTGTDLNLQITNNYNYTLTATIVRIQVMA